MSNLLHDSISLSRFSIRCYTHMVTYFALCCNFFCKSFTCLQSVSAYRRSGVAVREPALLQAVDLCFISLSSHTADFKDDIVNYPV